eukprot:GHVU01130986.1.p1 GENE.GHVU01130986.1~~GHVU01130986.1.p1  ORF type:complete len:190 (-),score=7.02 GHVU01130986.1:229-798(-)
MRKMKALYLSASCFVFFARSVVSQLHFASIGNWGSGGIDQAAVAGTLKRASSSEKFSFIVSPGSNFLGKGIKALNDTAWDSAFKNVYASTEMNLRFFTVLGDSDWKGNFTAQVLKSQKTYHEDFLSNSPHPRFTLPNYWYRYTVTSPDPSSKNMRRRPTLCLLLNCLWHSFSCSHSFSFCATTRCRRPR